MPKPGRKEKLINECQFCRNRFCYNRIVREEAPFYDEVYCNKHIREGEQEADRILGGHGSKVYRIHINGTGIQRRGIPVPHIEELLPRSIK